MTGRGGVGSPSAASVRGTGPTVGRGGRGHRPPPSVPAPRDARAGRPSPTVRAPPPRRQRGHPPTAHCLWRRLELQHRGRHALGGAQPRQTGQHDGARWPQGSHASERRPANSRSQHAACSSTGASKACAKRSRPGRWHGCAKLSGAAGAGSSSAWSRSLRLRYLRLRLRGGGALRRLRCRCGQRPLRPNMTLPRGSQRGVQNTRLSPRSAPPHNG